MPGFRFAFSRTASRRRRARVGRRSSPFSLQRALVHGAALLAGLWASLANADVVRMELDELIQRAAVIVEGECIGKRARLNERGNLILTDYQFAVRDVLFGSSAAYLSLTIAGGEIDEVRDVVSDMPVFAVGDSVVLMLHEGGMAASLSIVGLDQGLFRAVHREGDQRWYLADGGGALVPRVGGSGYYFYGEGVAALRDYIPVAKALPPADTGVVSAQLLSGTSRPTRTLVSALPEELVLFSDSSDRDTLRSPTFQPSDFFTERDSVPVVISSVPEDSAMRAALQSAVAYWNRYATLFLTDSEGDLGWAFGNGRNDVPGLVSEAQRLEKHGTGWEDGSIVTVIGRYENDVMVESDVLLNPAVNWSYDDAAAYFDAGVYSVGRALLRALGSVVGLNWQSSELSVMNLRNSADKFNAFGLLYGEDTLNVRSAFPTRARAVADLGVYLYRAGATNKVDEARLSTTTVVQGDSVQVQNFVIQNLGDDDAVPLIHWYLDPAPGQFSGLYIGSSEHAPLGPDEAFESKRLLTVPAASAPGTYYLRASLDDGGDVSANDASWLDQPLTVLAAAAPIPAVPAAPQASDGSFTDRVQVGWEAVAGAQTYGLARCDSAGAVNGSCVTLNVTGTAHADVAAEAGRTYYYSLRACNEAGCSDYGPADPGSRGLAAPAVPAAPLASDGAYSDRVRVEWGAVAGAASYAVLRCDDAKTRSCVEASATQTVWDDVDAPAGQVFYYRVRACNAAGCSEAGDSDSGFRRVLAPPAVPARPDASDALIGLVRVTWNSVAGADRYEVYRCASADLGACQSFAATGNVFDDSGASPGTAYYYRLKACGVDGCSDYSDYDVGRAEYRNPAPKLTVNGQTQLQQRRVGEPLVLAVALAANGNPKAADWWVARDGPGGLRFFDSAAKQWLSRQVVAYQGALFDLAALELHTDTVSVAGDYVYYFAVDTLRDGQLTEAQLHYAAVEVEVLPPLPPPAPARPSASDGAFTDRVRVTWAGAARAEQYALYRCTDTGTGSCASLAETAQTALDDTSARAGTTYYYRVKACNSGGCSGFSDYDAGQRAFVDPQVGLTFAGGGKSVTVKVGAQPTLALSLNTFGNRASADWWLAVQRADGGYVSYRSGVFPGWFDGLQPALQGPLQDVSGVTLPLPELGVGQHTVYFGVDTAPDGEPTLDKLHYDAVSVTVESCGKFEC